MINVFFVPIAVPLQCGYGDWYSLFPSRILLITAYLHLLLWEWEEIPLVIPSACLECARCKGEGLVGILGDSHLADGIEILGCFLPTTKVEETVSLESKFDESLVFIFFAELSE